MNKQPELTDKTRRGIIDAFWKQIGWTKREDLNYYDFVLNQKNIENFNA